ncbi:PfkB domain-containing protein [Forsythia ovata]|uniref:PfkB domain-containing protein n=1 Tax=Forsythia ovata TaxID=205694 RepID=A0ABD1X4A1_9LAMI
MGSVLDGYRNALKDTQKAFAEYRQSALLLKEPVYKDAGPGGLKYFLRRLISFALAWYTAIMIAKQEGIFVSLDLASFEMVQKFRSPLLQLLESGSVDLCFANEDEATELLRSEDKAGLEAALEFLAEHCQWAVVMHAFE